MWSVATNLKIVALSKKPQKRDLIPTLITGRTSQTIFKRILSRDYEKLSVYLHDLYLNCWIILVLKKLSTLSHKLYFLSIWIDEKCEFVVFTNSQSYIQEETLLIRVRWCLIIRSNIVFTFKNTHSTFQKKQFILILLLWKCYFKWGLPKTWQWNLSKRKYNSTSISFLFCKWTKTLNLGLMFVFAAILIKYFTVGCKMWKLI